MPADVGASMLPAWAEALRTSLAGPFPASSAELRENESSGAATQLSKIFEGFGGQKGLSSQVT